MENFQVLPLKEEARLSEQERLRYYNQFREYVRKRKLTNTTPGATTICPKLRNITAKIAVAVTKKFSDKNVEWIWDGTENIPEGAVLFAHTHQGVLDGFVWIPTIKQHCLILISAFVSKLMMLCQINTGLVVVNKQDRVNQANSKLDMIRLLLDGHSLCYFPEGAWNLSPNKLHLPMRYGFLDIARKAGVPVVPVVHEYTYDSTTEKITKIHTQYGMPIYISPYDDIGQKLEEYCEQISTMRFELIAEKGVFNRKDICSAQYINYLKGNYSNMRMGNIDPARENQHIYNSNDEFYLFHHINDIPFDENDELLPTPEIQRLNRIMKREFPAIRCGFSF